LRSFLSDFDINGILGTYPMHILSEQQWRAFLGEAIKDLTPGTLGSILDVGAGRGDVTSLLAPLFSKVSVTETSRSMAKRLQKQGFKTYEGDLVELVEGPALKDQRFDVISLLNVLDRCDRPLSLLASARRLLKPNAILLIALVLPYSPFVYDGPTTRPPKERLPIHQKGFEASTVEMLNLALRGLGLDIITMSRAPYLSGGDQGRELYELDDLLVLARAQGEPSLIL
jgi:SAM-dependent methyltransferase